MCAELLTKNPNSCRKHCKQIMISCPSSVCRTPVLCRGTSPIYKIQASIRCPLQVNMSCHHTCLMRLAFPSDDRSPGHNHPNCQNAQRRAATSMLAPIFAVFLATLPALQRQSISLNMHSSKSSCFFGEQTRACMQILPDNI